ncbi:MAG: HlyC/CorC family transporter [Alphaproteobacteria bacterium]|nr:HlyC/CorC family transporter [Alphaproteobacteria bacterium]
MHGAGAATLPDNIWLDAAIILLFVALSAFFAASETALTAASRARMHGLEKNGDKRAALVNRLFANRERLIGTSLLGNTLANIAASAFTTSLLVYIVGDRGAIYATVLMTIVLLIFAEVMPKTLAINYPDGTALLIARVFSVLVTICGPILIGVEAFVSGFLKLLGFDTRRRHSVLSGHEELKSAVDLLHREGGVARSDRDMFGGLLELPELEVSDVMVHRTKMFALNADLAVPELIRQVAAAPFSRVPLWRGEKQNIVGVLHARDLLRALNEAAGDISDFKIESIAIEPWFVPETTPVQDQLQAFLKRKTHFALVVDEYGVVMGLVTLEDIIEEIVGEISDEFDVSVQGVRILGDGSAIVDGSVPIRDLNRAMAWDLPDEDATTVAGLVINEARAIPESGQVFDFHHFRFEVLRKTRNRITSLKIVPETRKPGTAES